MAPQPQRRALRAFLKSSHTPSCPQSIETAQPHPPSGTHERQARRKAAWKSVPGRPSSIQPRQHAARCQRRSRLRLTRRAQVHIGTNLFAFRFSPGQIAAQAKRGR
eukprot:6941929-Prymnesium_polylepis.1